MQMAADDGGAAWRECKRGRRGAELHGSRQDKAAVTVASGTMLRPLPPPPLPLLWRQTFHLCKVIEVICRKGRERESRVPIKSHMKGESVSIVCPVSVNTAGYLLRQFGLSTSDTQRRPSWDSNLLVTSLLL